MAFQSKGLTGYNNVSSSQLKVAQQFIPDLVQALSDSTNLTSGPLQVVDYGCSEGKNSMLTFAEAFAEFRKTSDKAISLLHTDLPENSWSTVYNIINTSPESYTHIENIYYSTLGRSFFNQIVPSNSVHLGYSAYAMHYLSQKPKRNDGEFNWVFPAATHQAFSDLTSLLTNRLEELVVGGTLHIVINAREGDEDPSFNKYNFGSMKNLLDQGVITTEEFKNYVWHSYPFNTNEMLIVLKKFGEKIEIKKCHHGKIFFPYYEKYLHEKNLEVYKNEMKDMMRVMMRHPVLTCLERTDEEKERIFQLALEEIGNILDRGVEELYQDYMIVIIKKVF